MPRQINQAGYRLIKEFEAGPAGNSQPALLPYLCPAGKLTNGWGNTHNVAPGVAITVAQAEADLERNLDWAEACVEKCAKTPNDNEFAAMVSLCFNIGADPGAGFPSSTVLRMHNAGNKPAAAAAFAMWRKMRDPNSGDLVDSAGLLRRRNIETTLYLTPMPQMTTTPVLATQSPEPSVTSSSLMPQAVVPEKSAAMSKSVIAGGVTVAAGVGSVADQLDQVQPVLERIATTGASLQSFMKLGATALSIIALGAGAYMLWRYLQKKRRGEIMST